MYKATRAPRETSKEHLAHWPWCTASQRLTIHNLGTYIWRPNNSKLAWFFPLLKPRKTILLIFQHGDPVNCNKANCKLINFFLSNLLGYNAQSTKKKTLLGRIWYLRNGEKDIPYSMYSDDHQGQNMVGPEHQEQHKLLLL